MTEEIIKKRFCLAYNLQVTECLDKTCALRPCSFRSLVKEVSTLFKDKGFSGVDSKRMSRKLVLDCFTGEANENSE